MKTDIEDVNKILSSIESEPAKPGSQQRVVRHRLVEYILARFWAWRLRRIKRITGTIGFHPYPADKETGWRKDRKDCHGIKATLRLIQKVKDA